MSEQLVLIEKALGRVGSELGAAEAHGILTGLLCARGQVAREEWLGQVAPETGTGDLLAAEARRPLIELFDETVRQMGSSMLDFHPLLPDEEEPLADRVVALGEWCQGFVLGLSMGGLTGLDQLPGDAGEVIRDITAITRAENYEFTEGEEDEQAYFELVEYVRTGALLVNEEFNPTKAPPLETPLH